MKRRNFLQYTAAAGGMMAFPLSGGSNVAASPAPDMPMTTLGRTGVSVSRLALGCAQLGRSHMNQDDVNTIVTHAYEQGITYFDTAPNYNDSEARLGPALKGIRDKIFLVSKCEEATYDGAWKLLHESLKKLQTDRIDLLHIHNWGFEERFPDIKHALGDRGVLGALRKAKNEGLIRYIGVSGHLYPSRFHKILDTGEIDVIMNAVNFVSRHVYDFENKVWARARMDNLGLVAMKVLGGQKGGGSLDANIPKNYYQDAVRYALSIPGVHVVNIGVNSLEELKENINAVKTMKPLSPEEALRITRTGLELAQQPEWATVYGEPLL